jgi:outer membrane protein
MKNVPVALSGLSLVGVAVLFYLHFSASKTTAATKSSVVSGDIKIAYINADTVLKYYDYYKEVKSIFEAKGKNWSKIYRTVLNLCKTKSGPTNAT